MLLFIEGYPYNLDYEIREGLLVRDVLEGIVSFPEMEKIQSLDYVGYCYSKKAQDVVFFLPKVVLTGELNEDKKDDTIFGAAPQEIIDFEGAGFGENPDEESSKKYKDFLSSLSIWIYRTINLYRQGGDKNILDSREYQRESSGKKQKHNTLLDVIIALRDFNRNNQDYFTYIIKNLHSGHNKINWSRTIAKSQVIMQRGRPIYLNPANKRKVVNFDEELLIIYFSILNYIKHKYGFSYEINVQYDLISPKKLKQSYIDRHLGCRRLRQIKYKYFSDKALRIWDLCYAFFDREYKIAMNQYDTDYLLSRNFHQIFEAMIDALIGGEVPKALKEQKDGKLVDHMFIGQGLIEQSNSLADQTYYIGDSKYYKRGKGNSISLGDYSIYKQYSYARNVVQWSMGLFLDGKSEGQPQLRDKLTEGYNPIPNFFISARIPSQQERGERFLEFDDDSLREQESGVRFNRQYENRLFDRDTLLLCHYDVNFLFVVSLYGRGNRGDQAKWKEKVQKQFRESIQATLNKLYDFYLIQPRYGMNCYQYVKDNFHQLNGKLYRPSEECNYLVLALMKNDALWSERLGINAQVVEEETMRNEDLIKEVVSHFHVGNPFELSRELEVPARDNVGSLSKQLREELKNVLTGYVDSNDIGLDDFENHKGTNYIMKKIPSNLANIEYFLPMVKGKIDGYYMVERVSLNTQGEDLCLSLNLSCFYSLGTEKKQVYKRFLSSGQLISISEMMGFYNQD